jgi:hypothetical protein
MHIYFKRSGGYMGIPVTADLDTTALPTEEADAIEQMLDKANFFDLPSDPDLSGGADRFIFELTVVSKEMKHTVYFSEQNAPAEIDPLVRQLTLLARRPPEDSSNESL